MRREFIFREAGRDLCTPTRVRTYPVVFSAITSCEVLVIKELILCVSGLTCHAWRSKRPVIYCILPVLVFGKIRRYQFYRY